MRAKRTNKRYPYAGAEERQRRLETGIKRVGETRGGYARHRKYDNSSTKAGCVGIQWGCFPFDVSWNAIDGGNQIRRRWGPQHVVIPSIFGHRFAAQNLGERDSSVYLGGGARFQAWGKRVVGWRSEGGKVDSQGRGRRRS